MAEISRPELCIVGAGALGIALAQHARRLGASVTLVDRGIPEPGDGPQRSLRIAALAASAAAAAALRGGPKLGLGAADPKVQLKAVQDRARQVAAERAPADRRERLAALGIEVLSGDTQFSDPATLQVGQQQVRARTFLIAVGAEAAVPDIPGLAKAGYFTPDDLLDNARKLTHLLVIGADGEALALAQAYARLGSQVTVVPQGRALPAFDLEAAGILLQALAGEGVKVLDGAIVQEIQPRSQGIGAVIAVESGGTEALDLSHVLVSCGRTADLTALGSEAARLRPIRGDAGGYVIGAFGQTSSRKIHITGVMAGLKSWEEALSHGRSVVDTLISGSSRRRATNLPRLVLTDPPLAQIGRLPAEGAKLSAGHSLLRANMAENDMVRANGQSGGLIKVLAGPKGQVLGAAVVGPAAGEIAGVLALAVEHGLTLEALADLSLPQPSYFTSLVALGENRMATRTVSAFARRRGQIKRLLRI